MMNTKTLKNKSIKIIIGNFFSVIIYYINNFFYVLGSSEKMSVMSSVFIPLMLLTMINLLLIKNLNAK